jgi:hypothetical protein
MTRHGRVTVSHTVAPRSERLSKAMAQGLPLLLALLAAGCASAPVPSDRVDGPYVRLVEVEPAIGSRIDSASAIRVRAAYRVPSGGGGYRAQLMFLTESGSTASVMGAQAQPLTEVEGVIELTAVPGNTRRPLAQPVTAIVMIMPIPDVAARDTLAGGVALPEELRARLRQAGDTLAGDSTAPRVRAVSTSAPVRPLMRSRAIFYNGAGPATGALGPALPFQEVVAEYLTYRGGKALAVAQDSNGRRIWGYSFGYAQQDSADARAIDHCERAVAARSAKATCRLHARGDSILQR